MGYCRILFQISNGQAHPMTAYTFRIFICSGNKKNLKSELEKTAHIQKLANNKKILNFCPIPIKLDEKNYHMRQ